MILTKDVDNVLKINLFNSDESRLDLTHRFLSKKHFVAHCDSYDAMIATIKSLIEKHKNYSDVEKVLISEHIPITISLVRDWVFKVFYKNGTTEMYYLYKDNDCRKLIAGDELEELCDKLN